MRLNCPNCGAQYEVPDDVIPQAGRDVECSNCGNTWFQVHPDEDVELAAEIGGSVPDDGWTPEDETAVHATADSAADDGDSDVDQGLDEIAGPGHMPPQHHRAPGHDEGDDDVDNDVGDDDGGDDDSSDDDADPWPEDHSEDPSPSPEYPDDGHWPEDDAAPETGDEDADEDDDRVADDNLEDDDEAEEDDDAADQPPQAPAAIQPRRRSLDPAIAELLRQEALHEAEARKAEGSDLETQPDLGLDGGAGAGGASLRDREAQSRMAKLRGQQTDPHHARPEATAKDPRSEARRELLPDIEDINATLRSAEDRQPEERVGVGPSNSEKRRRGFRLGFGLVFLTAALGVLVYLYHARIAAEVPQAAPYVDAYMVWINNTRLWLDTQVTDMMIYLDNLSDQEPPADG